LGAIGEVIGPYEIRGELGRGAMATVWRAWDTKLDREIALKEPLMPAGASGDIAEQLAQRFVREGKASARLNHPGIVTIFNAEVFDGRPVIVMELIEGQTLGDILGAGPLPPDVAASITDQLLDAVGYAHSRGIVHRDIKPDNIFVLADGRIKLADFGIAHVESQATMTQAGTIMGTPGYMAPEQITGQPVDARADLYAVGVVGWEMLIGRNPFGATEGTSLTTVMFRVVQEEAPDIQTLNPSLAGPLAETIRISMAKDPAWRFGTAAEMRMALRGGEVVVGGAPVVGVGAAVGGAPSVPAAPMPAWQPPTVASKPDHTSRNLYIAVGALGVLIAVGLLFTAMRPANPGGTPYSAGAVPAEPATPTPVVPEVPIAEVPPVPAVSDAQKRDEVMQAVDSWKAAWESMSTGDYMAFYAKSFKASSPKKRNYSAWRSWKSGVFSDYSYQSVTITGLSVDVSGDTAKVSFTQDFSQDSKTNPAGYHDVGTKQMTWVRQPDGTWLITRENWY
jgi:serine/threonine-protein kinase